MKDLNPMRLAMYLVGSSAVGHSPPSCGKRVIAASEGTITSFGLDVEQVIAHISLINHSDREYFTAIAHFSPLSYASGSSYTSTR